MRCTMKKPHLIVMPHILLYSIVGKIILGLCGATVKRQVIVFYKRKCYSVTRKAFRANLLCILTQFLLTYK